MAMIVLAVLLAYLMALAATFLQKRGVRRSIGVLIIYFSTALPVAIVGALTSMVVFIAIRAGAEIYGLLGTLLAIPVAGILRVALDRLFPSDPEIEALVRQVLHVEVERTGVGVVGQLQRTEQGLS
jgi:predicted PurR-regulated permease PerM